MQKTNEKWTVKKLLGNLDMIEFPEFQREPTVWDLGKKRKLIDSILRNFDIATIYFNKRSDGVYECIDGRQRINAILSFVGQNELEASDPDQARYHNEFTFNSSDELLSSNTLARYDKKTFKDFKKAKLDSMILDYEFNVLEISGIDQNEYVDVVSLMFLRLQLGVPLNGGEKLNAMRGEMRNLIFDYGNDKGLGQHAYFEFLKIPNRRFAREQTAAQIALNFFALETGRGFRTARFKDLQQFFSANARLTPETTAIADALRAKLDLVFEKIKNVKNLDLKNRAIGVTTFFFINAMIDQKREKEIPTFIKFLKLLLVRLKEQVEKGIDIERRYRDLLTFQTYISQAAVEKYAIENRQTFLSDYFDYYLKNRIIKGDKSVKKKSIKA